MSLTFSWQEKYLPLAFEWHMALESGFSKWRVVVPNYFWVTFSISVLRHHKLNFFSDFQDSKSAESVVCYVEN